MKLSRQFPLNALRVFEAAARHMSFTKAAEELGMTQTAVSYQVKLLEDNIGEPLFLRKPRQIALTWFKGQMGVTDGDAMSMSPWGLSWYHLTTTAFLWRSCLEPS